MDSQFSQEEMVYAKCVVGNDEVDSTRFADVANKSRWASVVYMAAPRTFASSLVTGTLPGIVNVNGQARAQ